MRQALSLLLLLVLLLVPGFFARDYWTPDEPREADIAWRMSQQQDWALPALANEPFLEKPPLTYWFSGAAMATLGATPASARVPNLVYAIATLLALAALARSLLTAPVAGAGSGTVNGGGSGRSAAGPRAAVLAVLAFGSMFLAWRTMIWLAPDAGLLAGTSIALLGGWLGFNGAPGGAKLRGYSLMHLGAAIGFMAKSAPGWLVPAIALLTLIAWERRFSELRRWELYAGLLLQLAIIGPWIAAVLAHPDGLEALRVLFWNNLAGRFTHVDAPVQYQYANAHRNYPGKYLVELPLYLLPWTLPAVAALWRARKGATVPGPHRSAWRYALACCLPFLILLSLAATARDIYATPAMNGFALLLALWVLDRPEAGLARDRWALNCALVLALVLAAVATFFILLLAEGERLAGRPPWRLAFAAFAIAACATVAGVATRRAVRRDTLLPALRGVFLVYMSTMIIALAALAPVFDRWNDLPRVARRIADATHGRPLALLQPDETTIAMMDYRLATPFEHLRGDASASVSLARGWFERAGTDAVVLVKLPGRGPGEITGLLARLNVREPVQKQDMVDALVAARVAHIEQRFMIPHGRSFVLLAAGSGPAGGPTDSPAAVD